MDFPQEGHECKSFVTDLLANGFVREGFRIGILDSDITGTGIPMVFRLHDPLTAGHDGIQPLVSRSGINVISI